MVSLGEYMVLICFSMFSGAPNISSLEKGEIPRSTRTWDAAEASLLGQSEVEPLGLRRHGVSM